MRKKLFVLCVIAIAAALLLTACAGADLTLTFEVDGEVYATVTTMGKEAIQMPKDPEKEGYIFDGWYWDKDVWEKPFTANSLLESPLSSNMTVYAKWKLESDTHEHSFGEWKVVTPATCNAEGLQKHACTVCGEEETEAIPTVPHTYGKWGIVTPATCTAEGLQKHVCSVCEEEETQAITTIPHTYETKYDETNHWSECSVCGETANAEAHTYANEVCTVCGKNYGTKGLEYEKIKGGYEVDGIGTAEGTAIEIPSKYEGEPVISIGDWAFEYCLSLTSIEIPNSVTSIGSNAFRWCYSLTIFTEAAAKPSGWDSGWNYSNCPVVWDYKNNDVADDGYIYTIQNGIRYALKDGAAVVKRQPSNITKANIASEIIYKDTRYSVTSIGSSAFSGCSSLTSIAIPDSVTSIGDYAFRGCGSLTSIEIPDSVTSIGDYAFRGCGSLTSIEIPDSVTSIGDYAFYNCSSLTGIAIPDSVTSIGSYAFYETGIWNNTADNNVVYADKWAVGYKGDKGTLSGALTLKADTVGIGSSAFSYCSKLTSIAIPDSVTSIGSSAFSECSSLTSIAIPDSVTSIGDNAFNGCSSLTINAQTAVKPSGWNSNWNYFNCPVVWDYKNNDVADDGYIYTVQNGIRYGIKDGAAVVKRQPINITEANIASEIVYKETRYSVTSIDSYAFSFCSSLTSIAILDGVTSIGREAFYECSSLRELKMPAEVAGVYGASYVTKVVITSGTSIGSYAFSGCSSLTSITILDGVTSIGREAFYVCISLTSIAIPDSVTSIGYSAFSGCSSLTSIAIPDSVTSIGSEAFYYCSSLTSIAIGNSVTSIGSNAFNRCSSLETLTVAEGNTKYHSAGNCLIETATKTLILGCKNSVIPTDGRVTSIGSYAFERCYSLTNIEIPDSVTSIGNSAFDGCWSLTSIAIPDSVTSIGSSAFYGCRSLTSIAIGNSVTSIGSYAFSECISLTSIAIPDSVTSIGYNAFFYCSSLQSIEYQGTKAEWKAITKGNWWNYNTSEYTVTCTDGTLSKAES